MKRGPGPKRRKRPKRSGFNPEYRPSDAAIKRARRQSAADFKEAAREQRVCAVCGADGPFDAHHVVEAQYLRKNNHPEFVRANALRLCNRYSKNDCHGKHTSGSRKLRLRDLTDENIDYAFAVLGPQKAESYLQRHYRGTDPRLQRALEEYVDPES